MEILGMVRPDELPTVGRRAATPTAEAGHSDSGDSDKYGRMGCQPSGNTRPLRQQRRVTPTVEIAVSTAAWAANRRATRGHSDSRDGSLRQWR